MISALILAVVQGIAEWFPISSSGHLVLVSKLLGFNNTLLFDVALHFGTLSAVFVYFGADIIDILRDLVSFKFKTESGKIGIFLIIATIPAGILGFFLKDLLESELNNLYLLALGLAITSIVLFIGSIDIRKYENKITYKKAFLIGLAQTLSLFRGISRSGITMSAGLLLGLDEKKAVRFSFLMSIPIIFGANILTIGNQKLPSELFLPSLVSFLVGIVTIHLLLKFVLTSRRNLRWFGAYTSLLALGIFIYYFIKI